MHGKCPEGLNEKKALKLFSDRPDDVIKINFGSKVEALSTTNLGRLLAVAHNIASESANGDTKRISPSTKSIEEFENSSRVVTFGQGLPWTRPRLDPTDNSSDDYLYIIAAKPPYSDGPKQESVEAIKNARNQDAQLLPNGYYTTNFKVNNKPCTLLLNYKQNGRVFVTVFELDKDPASFVLELKSGNVPASFMNANTIIYADVEVLSGMKSDVKAKFRVKATQKDDSGSIYGLDQREVERGLLKKIYGDKAKIEQAVP